MLLSVPERLSLSSFGKKLTVHFFTQWQHKITWCIAIASCTTSVYVNLSKNSFLSCSPAFQRESGCKGTHFLRTSKTFLRYFLEKVSFLHFLWKAVIKSWAYTLLYIICNWKLRVENWKLVPKHSSSIETGVAFHVEKPEKILRIAIFYVRLHSDFVSCRKTARHL